MARPSKHDGVVYRRKDSNVWWMRYRDKSGSRRLESTHTEDWQEAQRQLRERLEAGITIRCISSAGASCLLLAIGQTFSWKTIPSRLFAAWAHTKRTLPLSRVCDRCSAG